MPPHRQFVQLHTRQFHFLSYDFRRRGRIQRCLLIRISAKRFISHYQRNNQHDKYHNQRADKQPHPIQQSPHGLERFHETRPFASHLFGTLISC